MHTSTHLTNKEAGAGTRRQKRERVVEGGKVRGDSVGERGSGGESGANDERGLSGKGGGGGWRGGGGRWGSCDWRGRTRQSSMGSCRSSGWA